MRILIVALMLLASPAFGAKEWPAEPKDTDVKIDNYLKAALKDRESFRDYAITKPFQCKWGFKKVWCACTRGNAKNSYGGYTGIKTRIAYFNEYGELKILDPAPTGTGEHCSNQEWIERDPALVR